MLSIPVLYKAMLLQCGSFGVPLENSVPTDTFLSVADCVPTETVWGGPFGIRHLEIWQ